ncbi:MAG: pth [Acidimicrobiaceae bacterium]|nr:pth [Acidimicrobiaceae bacterium]
MVGLANPGTEYEGSRHNVGGDAVRLVVARRGAKFSHERRQRAESVTLSTPRGAVTFAIPTTFMNESGAAIAPLLRRTSIDDLSELVVVHDELDLEPGRLQLRLGGGLAGHNGLRSIASTLGTQEFARLRIGIGKPPSKEQGADYVLRRSTGKQREVREAEVARAADAIETLVERGFDDAQQRVNGS